MGFDRERFAGVYEELYPRVLAYAMRRAAAEDARDAVDEAFLIAWRRRSELPDVVLPWLLVTVRNILANQGRRRRRQDVIVAEVARQVEYGAGVDTEASVVERVLVLSALSELTVRDRDALMLAVWDNLTGAEAARVAGCSSVTFAVRLHRAKRRFAAALQRLDDQPLDDRPVGSSAGVDGVGNFVGKDL